MYKESNCTRHKLGHAKIARVCVYALRKSVGGSAITSESQDGAAMPPRGRVLRTRQDRSTTTTNYILSLDSSSIGREGKANLTLRTGWVA